jgi:DNA-binding MarR family transcriptional regulator
MSEIATQQWGFLTNHAQVLVCIARDPEARVRDIGESVGITERAAHRVLSDLVGAGYVTRERQGRRNRYTLNEHLALPDTIARKGNVGELLGILNGR